MSSISTRFLKSLLAIGTFIQTKWRHRLFTLQKSDKPTPCKHYHQCFKHACEHWALHSWSNTRRLLLLVLPGVYFVSCMLTAGTVSLHSHCKHILAHFTKQPAKLLSWISESLIYWHYCSVPDNPALSEMSHCISSFPLLWSRTLWKN